MAANCEQILCLFFASGQHKLSSDIRRPVRLGSPINPEKAERQWKARETMKKGVRVDMKKETSVDKSLSRVSKIRSKIFWILFGCLG